MSLGSRMGVQSGAAVTGGGGTATPAVNALGGTSNGATPTSLTWTHVVGSGSNRALVVGTASNGTGTISGVTYGGVALTRLQTVTSGTAGADRQIDVFYNLAPTSGSASVVVTYSVSPSGGSGESIDFINVHQSTPFGTRGTNTTAAAASLSASATCTATDIILAMIAAQSTTAPVQGGSQTLHYTRLAGTNVYNAGSTIAGGTAVASSFTFTSGKAALIAIPMLGA